MAGVNKAILIGNLGRDPELKRTPGGQSVATFTLATTEKRTDKNGQKQERTEWHNIVAWGRLAELAGQYLKKGRTIFLEGRISNRSWDDKDGNKKYRSEIVASSIQFLSSPGQQSENRSPEHAQPAQTSSTDDFDIPDTVSENSAGGSADDLPF
jgi:single-strand DNA-binding protein